jgi:hypothetical protein
VRLWYLTAKAVIIAYVRISEIQGKSRSTFDMDIGGFHMATPLFLLPRMEIPKEGSIDRGERAS